MIFIKNAGKNVAITKDKNSNDWGMNGEKISFEINTPTNKLFEKSGNGNINKPPAKPIKIEKYAVFSFIDL